MSEKGTESMDRLREAGQGAFKALSSKVMSSMGDKVTNLTDKFDSIGDGEPMKKAAKQGVEAKAEGKNPLVEGVKGAASGLKDKVTGGGGDKGSSGGKATKSTNIIESIDVGVP